MNRLIKAVVIAGLVPLSALAQSPISSTGVQPGTGTVYSMPSDIISPQNQTVYSGNVPNGNVSAATTAAAQGAGGTGITAPTGGSGILGWLSGIYQKLSGSLVVTGTFWQTTQPVSAVALPLPSGAATAALQNLALPAGANVIGTVLIAPLPGSGQGFLTATTTSKTITMANVTTSPGSSTFPTSTLSTGALRVKPTGAVYICW
jgi:hypothetical protein